VHLVVVDSLNRIDLIVFVVFDDQEEMVDHVEEERKEDYASIQHVGRSNLLDVANFLFHDHDDHLDLRSVPCLEDQKDVLYKPIIFELI
jgi:hypothetical protein